MERNIMGELNMYRQAGTKPNFSEMARRHEMGRHAVAKYWRGGEEVEDRRSCRPSGSDRVREVTGQKASLPGATRKAVHELLLHRYPDLGLPKCNALGACCDRHGEVYRFFGHPMER